MDKLFGADGIRGIIDQPPLTTDGVQRIGRAVGTWFLRQTSQPVILIGTDTRESCSRLKMALIHSINQVGVHTLDCGILPTAAVSFLLADRGYFAGGMIISASHNPINENGIKVMDGHGLKLDDLQQDEIVVLYQQQEFLETHAYARGRNIFDDVLVCQYAETLMDEFLDLDWHTIHFLLDCANGAAYDIAPSIFRNLGIRFYLANAWPDGTNINKSAGSEYVRLDPSRMVRVLHELKLPFGLALDGDADRVVFVDENGHFYDGDMLLAMMALKYQKEQRLSNGKVVITPMSNSGLEEYLNSLDIEVGEVPNGDKYISQAILRENLILGGEQIGHIIVHDREMRLTGDGIRTALIILAELAKNPGIQLYDLAGGMHKWPQVNVSVCLPQRTRIQKEMIPGIMEKIDQMQSHWSDIRVRACRPASTEPSYRIMLESRFTPVTELAVQARQMAALIQNHLGCEDSSVFVLDLTHGGLI